MSFIIADRVQETTTTTGSGTLTLNGATTQYQGFSGGIGSGNATYYTLTSGSNNDWEVGIGTVTVSIGVTTLSRDVILASSNSNAAIVLTSGTHTVSGDAPASMLLIGSGTQAP